MSEPEINEADTHQIVREVARLVGEHYVFADVADQLRQLLLGRLADGHYSTAMHPSELAPLVTADLQSVNGDRHLRLLFSDEPLVDLEDEAAEREMWSERARADAGGIAGVEQLAGNIGRLTIRPLLYPATLVGDRIAAAMTLLADTDALIIDLRECVGGSPGTVALLCTYLFDYEPVHLNTMVTRDPNTSEQSWTSVWVPGRRFGSRKPVHVLTGGATFSGAEELAYDLQQLGRATVVGEQTGGGANPREGFRVHVNLEATISVAQPINPASGTNWEGPGVTPDVASASGDALEVSLGLLREQLTAG